MRRAPRPNSSADALRAGTDAAAPPPAATDAAAAKQALASANNAPPTASSDAPPTAGSLTRPRLRPLPRLRPRRRPRLGRRQPQCRGSGPAGCLRRAVGPAGSRAIRSRAQRRPSRGRAGCQRPLAPPPGAEPAVPAVPMTPGAQMAMLNPSDAQLGFKPSSAPPLNSSLSPVGVAAGPGALSRNRRPGRFCRHSRTRGRGCAGHVFRQAWPWRHGCSRHVRVRLSQIWTPSRARRWAAPPP